jgi:hypothetical protein
MKWIITLTPFLLIFMSHAGEPPQATRPPLRRTYIETFDRGPGGWYADRYFSLPVWDGVAYCYSPWWLDANHAPPGAGYLHLLLWLDTNKSNYEGKEDIIKSMPYVGNRFAEGGYSRDFTNVRLTVRMRGEADLKGAQILILVQAKTAKTTPNMVLSGQPLKLTKDWSEQTVTLKPDPKEWTCLGSRHDMTDEYGCDDIATVLKDVNEDIIFVLFPVKAVPASPEITGPEIDRLRAVKDYPVLQDALPKGLIMFDTIRIEYPSLKRRP